jgi:hypothetical protein
VGVEIGPYGAEGANDLNEAGGVAMPTAPNNQRVQSPNSRSF